MRKGRSLVGEIWVIESRTGKYWHPATSKGIFSTNKEAQDALVIMEHKNYSERKERRISLYQRKEME